MKKIIRISIYSLLAAVATLAVVYAQYKKPGSRPGNIHDKYLYMAKAYLTATPGMKYNYSYRLFHNGAAVDSMIGRLEKWQQDYVDSNNYYSKILSGLFFVSLNHKEKQAQYMSIADLESKMGVSREQMFSEVISIPDSSFFTAGDLSVTKRTDDLITLTYVLKDTAAQMKQMVMVLNEKQQSVEEITMQFRIFDNDGGMEREPTQDRSRFSVLKIKHLQPINNADGATLFAKGYYTVQDNNIVLSQGYKGYKLSRL